jgi:TrmH family RNA methyltransferase
VPAASDAALEWLTANQFQVFAARVDGELNYTAANYLGRAAIVLGNEARGLSEQWSSPAIKTVRLPMLGAVDSLNLSATAAVLFYEALRQRSV